MCAAVQMLDSDCRFETWNPPREFIDRSKFRSIPRQGIGRGFKAGKEEIVGLLTALQIFATQSQEERIEQMKSVAKYVADSFQGHGTMTARYLDPSVDNPLPSTEIVFRSVGGPAFMFDLILRLKAASPPIYFNETYLDKMMLVVNPSTLTMSQAEELVHGLKALVP